VAIYPKTLAQIKPNTNALTLLYKAPTNVTYTSIAMLNVCNQDGSPNYFSVTLAQGDVTANSTQYVFTNNVINNYSTSFVSPAMALSPNDAIYVSTTQKTSTQILDASGSSNTANLSIAVTSGSPNVTGTNTNFTTLTPGSYILVTGATPSTQQILSITNATSLVAVSNYTGSISGTSAYILGFGNVSYTLSGVEILAPPTVSSISVSSGSNAGGTSINIIGKYFTGTTAVQFGGVYSSFTVNSDTSITAIAPAVPYATTVDITVTNAGGVSTPVQADQFTYYYPQPVITSITPNSGSVYGGDSVVITGTGFAGTQTVKFGDTYVSFVLNSNTQITAVSSPVGIAQTVDISITTPGGVSSNSVNDRFTFTSIV
jgi:hypothetical protein